ncbi:hypothetical protein N7481_002049 [Penicillium waksmanii]|uniref:uncharacterized protein n=1 Tax=Penicillium waksmanii TaxID=69791 RepID=UPI002547D6FB|nr:uncharacterized protein N7481_002049 [Penicillium waksmanii]KAJ5995072.1 hypothetical protein N7481_002049 [Penicillium waksmanii]
MSTIQGQAASRQYVPDIFIEGAIKLTLGKTHLVIYAVENGENGEHGSDFLIPSRDGKLDFEAENAWKEYGVDFKQFWK